MSSAQAMATPNDAKQRPILFTGAMVRAILDGSKTQARIVIKPNKAFVPGTLELDPDGAPVAVVNLTGCMADVRCPYGQPGDLLYVRETWRPRILNGALFQAGPDGKSAGRFSSSMRSRRSCLGFGVQYREGFAHMRTECYAKQFADCTEPTQTGDLVSSRWKPSIHMPKWAARLWLRVTEVRVERVREISDEDVKAEGIGRFVDGCGWGWDRESCLSSEYDGWGTPERAFETLWDSINAKRGFGWETDPWVWVVTFERAEKP